MLFLPDTSAWIGFFGKQQSPAGVKLAKLISLDQDVCLCGPALMESLQGIRFDEQWRKIHSILGNFQYLDIDRGTYLDAANIHRTCRASGFTIRKTIDCIIAATAIRHGAYVIHQDRDFDAIAKFFPLQVY